MDLNRIAELAREDPGRKFLSVAHLLTPQALYEAFVRLRKNASAGVDHLTYAEYEPQARERIELLHEKLKAKRYRAHPLRRVYIEKEDGRERPISIPALEDKIVQRATVELLEAIYEQDFLPCSYGFRPGRGAQQALDEVGRIICRESTEYVLKLDIVSYFDSVVREQLMAMIERRVGDGSILRLIRKWIHVGVIEDGRLLVSERGTGQGQVISPLLSNIYLHVVLDEWFETEVRPRLKGKAFEVRYADDGLLCFQYREDAERVLQVLHKRFAKFGLTLHPEKTCLIEFGRSAHWQGRRTGSKPATFDFLGYVFAELMLRRALLGANCRAFVKLTTHKFCRPFGWHPRFSTEVQPCSINCSSPQRQSRVIRKRPTQKSVGGIWPRVLNKVTPIPRCCLWLRICSGSLTSSAYIPACSM